MLTAKAKSQHHESEIFLMQNSVQDRIAIYNSEISNLQAMIQSQNQLQLQRSGLTENEIRTYIIKKISQAEDEHKQESMMVRAMIPRQYANAGLKLPS